MCLDAGFGIVGCRFCDMPGNKHLRGLSPCQQL